MTRRCCLAAALAAGCLAGCGDDGSADPSSTARRPPPVTALTASERAAADRSVAAIRTYCRRLARSLAGEGNRRPSLDGPLAAARRLAALARARPTAPYRGRQTARDLVADLAEDLEGTNCSGALATELARGL